MKYFAPLLLLFLAGCATSPVNVTSWLDPVSVATITAQAQPLMFALLEPTRKFQPTQGFNEREYAQLTAIEVNRMGERRLYMVVTSWSKTRPYEQRTLFRNAFSSIELRLGERNIDLTAHEGTATELGIGQSQLPLQLHGSDYRFYPLERADLKALAATDRIVLAATGIPSPLSYEELTETRSSLSAFIDQLPPESSPSRTSATRGENVGS